MKKLIFCLIIISLGSINQLNSQGLVSKGSQAEQLVNTHFNIDQFIIELKSEFNLTEDLFHEHENAFMKIVFKSRMEFIKRFVADQESVLTVDAYFENVKNEIRQKVQAYLSVTSMTSLNFSPNFQTTNSSQLRGPGDPCVNPDFEMCNFTNWDLYTGTVSGAAPYSFTGSTSTTSFSTANTPTAQTGTSGNDQHYICTGGTDTYGFPMVYPGGSCSAALGDFAGLGYDAAQIRQTFLVSSGDAILTLNYAVCLEDGGHSANEQPYFRMRVYDAAGNSINCAEYEATAGDGQAGWVTSGIWQYKPWTTVFIPLAPFVGQNVTVEFTVGDCSQGGHAGYAYVDASCNAMAFNMTAQSVCAGNPITITAPAGAASYLWNTGATTQAINTSTAGTYSVTVTPVTGSSCAITLDTTVVAFPNPIANFSHDAPVCIGQNVNFTDLSNPNGSTITQWSWTFGDATTSTLQSPVHAYAAAGTFNVVLTVTTSDGCTHTTNQNVTINAGGTPVIDPAGPFCSTAAPVILTSNIAGGTWSATCGTCINAATGSFDPTLATVGNNTITYSIAGACSGSDTEVIQIESIGAPVIANTDIDCFGNCIGTITLTATGATQFSIDGGTTFQATGNFNSLCANTYNLVAQSPIGCQVTGTATIVEPLPLLLPTAFTDETCFGSCDGVAIVAPQDGTSPYSYSWSNGGGNVPTINNLCVGIYTVTVTDNNGCIEVTNITVGGPAQVLITSIVEVDETCTNSCDGSITITAPLATQFSIDGGVTFQASNVFNGVCSGTYNVVVQDATPCQATGTATVTTPNPLNIIAGPNSTICIGQSATVSATANGGTAPVTLIWDNGLPNGSPHNVTPAATTTYTVFAQDGNGCSTSPVQIIVTLNPPLDVVAQSNQAICPGFSANISALASGGNGGPYTYSWNDGAGNILNGANQTVSPAVTTNYTVTASDNCGTPVATDVVTITVNPLPVVTFVADNLQGCTPVSVNFSNTTNAALTGSCFWDFGDGTTSATCDPNHVYTVPGCYTVTLTVTSPDGCIASATVVNMICVFAYPVAEFSFGPQPTDILNTEIFFTNETTLGVAYEWDFDGLGTSQSTNPSFVFPNIDPGTYPVCLATVSADGCVDTVCHDVIILDLFLIYVPNTFTPDNDGINDYFFPVLDGYDPLNFKMMIFNRWGELIFESGSPESKWDGTYKGIMSKEDTYVWKILTKDVGTGKKREFIGHVNLLK